MAVLETGDIRRIFITATDHPEEAVRRGATADDDALLVAATDAQFPMLSDGDAPDHDLEFFERREALAHVEPRVHLRHIGKWGSNNETGEEEDG